jgi:hypothetical protein
LIRLKRNSLREFDAHSASIVELLNRSIDRWINQEQIKEYDQNTSIMFISRSDQNYKVGEENRDFGMSIAHIRYAVVMYYILYKYEC